MNMKLGTFFAVALLLTACTDYSQNFENDFGYAKSGKGVEFSGSTLKDLRDDHVYNVAKVNDIYWMMQDLAYEYYNTEKYGKTFCPDGNSKICNSTGWLYPGEHLDNVCPEGWRLPTYQEWNEFYNSSVFSSQKGTILYNGKLGGDGELDFKGEYAYYWVNNDFSNESFVSSGGGYKACALISKNGDIEGATCHQQWKVSVRCVTETDSDAQTPSVSSSPDEHYDCTVEDGVKVVYPAGGESFKIGEEITVVYGTVIDDGGFQFVFKHSEDDEGRNFFDEFKGINARADGKTCYEQKVKLTSDIIEGGDSGFIRIIPFNHADKAANSGYFKIYAE